MPIVHDADVALQALKKGNSQGAFAKQRTNVRFIFRATNGML